MAFVYRSDRKIDLAGKENLTLGPGAYVGHKEYKPKYQAHQPFDAQTGRRDASKTQLSQTAFNPGPGQYQVTAGFEQISKSMQSAKNLSLYGLEKFGITVIKPSNCFASKVDRFQDPKRGRSEKSHTPGPGQYSNESDWIKSKKQAAKPEWQMNMTNKMYNPPSIPSHDNVFGYEEGNNGELLKQPNSLKVHTGTKSDTVGPGEYEVVKPIGATKKGPQWHLPKTNKKPVPTTTDIQKEIPGPGHYNAEKVDIFPIYKYKPSSVFVSKVARETHKGLRSSTHMSGFGLPPKPHTAASHQEDDYYDEDDEDQPPGPGSYYNPHQSTTFKVKSVPERLQFFGSTVERFHDQTDKQKIPPAVGPGSYSVNAPIGQKKIRTNHNVPFQSNDQRFTDKQALVVPGPGTYQSKTLIENLQKKTWGKQGVFGSTEKRFVQAQSLQTPGPGMYKPERSVVALDKKNETNIKRSSSMFLSQTKRNPYEDMKSKAALPVVQYDDKTNTISEEVRRKVEVGVGNPLLANLKAKRGVNPGFSSNAQRFPQKKLDEAETFLGPGYYEQQGTFDAGSKNTVAALSTQSTSGKPQHFLSQAPRFVDVKKKLETPGPGQYSSDDMNGWFKRTYNMIFTD